MARRLIDIVISVIGILAVSPLLGVIGILIKVGSKGPILFKQTRIGLDGKPFAMVKLRTMTQLNDSPSTSTQSEVNEDRVVDVDFGCERCGRVEAECLCITPVGRWLRRTGIDELVQLVNVIKGDMSLIGPRPTVSDHVVSYTDTQRKRLTVRPGITGWAQVHGRNRLTWDQRIELDLWYIQNRSPQIDLQIAARTIVGLVSGHLW